MTPEELLKPRFLLTNDYPGNNREVGSISIEIHTAEYFRKYKANFRELEWWEEREVSELIGLIVRNTETGLVTKVHEPISKDGAWFVWDNLKNSVPFRNYVPATESEYNEYIKSKQAIEKM